MNHRQLLLSFKNSIISLLDSSLFSQPKGQGYGGQHRQWPRDLGGRTDPGSQPRPGLVTDNLPTLGDAPVPLLAVDTAEDGGRGWAEDVAEAAAELRHGVLELTEQPHLTISRSRGSLELEKVSQHSFASSFPSRSMTITSAVLACQYPRLFLLIGFYIVTY